MSKMTRKQIVVYYYTVILGYSHEKVTSKYVVLQKDDINVYIGKNGAIRKGKNLTESISLTDRTDFDKMRLKVEEHKGESKMLNERKTCKTCMYFEIDNDYPERGICTLENCIVRIYCRCKNHIE